MGFLKKLRDAVFGSGSGRVRDPNGIYLYVKCDRCGAPVRIRADKYHDLLVDYDTGERVLHKEVMDGTCFALIQTTTRFDANFRILDQEAQGGEFITQEEYESLTSPGEPTEEPEA